MIIINSNKHRRAFERWEERLFKRKVQNEFLRRKAEMEQLDVEAGYIPPPFTDLREEPSVPRFHMTAAGSLMRVNSDGIFRQPVSDHVVMCPVCKFTLEDNIVNGTTMDNHIQECSRRREAEREFTAQGPVN